LLPRIAVHSRTAPDTPTTPRGSSRGLLPVGTFLTTELLRTAIQLSFKFHSSPKRKVFKLSVTLNTFETYGAPRHAACEHLQVYAGTEGLRTRKENTEKTPEGANANLEENVEEVDPWNFLP
jgi:hypothetical protein